MSRPKKERDQLALVVNGVSWFPWVAIEKPAVVEVSGELSCETESSVRDRSLK
jgi:hypothetical protein